MIRKSGVEQNRQQINNLICDAPIFIVGTPRSGTTLLAAILSAHSRIACGPETHFFNKICPSMLQEAISDPDWPSKAVKIIASLTLAEQKVHTLFHQSLPAVTSFLSQREPSIPAMLESLTESNAKRLGKKRWVEKTPNHILFLNEIRRAFPYSPIIRIVRDARDCGMSMRKLPWASESILANCKLCTDWFKKSHSFFQRDKNTLTILYESLVLDPQTEVKSICEFIGEKFESSMLNTENSAHEVSSPNELWKI